MMRLIKIVAIASLAIAAGGAFAEDPQLCMVGESTTAECKGDRLAPMAKTFNAVSPDGLNELLLEIGEKGMKYSVWRRGKAIVEPTGLALKVGGSWLNGREVFVLGTEMKSETRKVEGMLATPIYKKSAIDLAANETKVYFGDLAVRLHVRAAVRQESQVGGREKGEGAGCQNSDGGRQPRFARLCL